jgi:hypothetical protein
MKNLNSCCDSFHGQVPNNINDTYHAASIWNCQYEKGIYLQPKYALQILLILAGYVELLPGLSHMCICMRINWKKMIRKNQSTTIYVQVVIYCTISH